MKPLRPLVFENRALGAVELATGAALTSAAVARDWVVLLIALPVVALVYAAWIHQLLWAETLAPRLEAVREPPIAAVEAPVMTVVRCALLVGVFAAGLVGLAIAMEFFTAVAAVQVGQGLATLVLAVRLARWEREHDGRLLRAPVRRPWDSAEIYLIPRSRTPP